MPFKARTAGWRHFLDHDPNSPILEVYDDLRGERDLWAVCLIGGIFDLIKPKAMGLSSYRKGHIEAVKKRARDWLLSSNVGEGSFIFCCEACGVNARELRKIILYYLQNNPKELKKRLANMHTIDHRGTAAYSKTHGRYERISK